MRIVSFFSGCGGLDLGFRQAGFQVIWADELEPKVHETYLVNHPGTILCKTDVNKLMSDDIPDSDGFIGGPPCQSWSIAGKQRGLEDERGKLILTYIDLIKTKQPKFFVLENVKGLLDEKFKLDFQDFIARLDDAGYDVQYKLLDAVDYRVPQNRERVFIIGFRKDLKVKYEFPEPTCLAPIPLEKAIGDIREEPVRYKDGDVLENTTRANHDVLSTAFGPYYHRSNRRRGWNQPSYTIHATAQNIPLHPSSPKMIYYGREDLGFVKGREAEYRRMSVRECARIQTFPDSFRFVCPDIIATYKMIGNAVPPRLACELAKSILKAMQLEVVNNAVKYQPKPIPLDEAPVLVGYFKNRIHFELILKNLVYYVRSDGRKGSMFKEDCSIIPQYLLLHNHDRMFLYKLCQEEPQLAEASFLDQLGFSVSGSRYLYFTLESAEQVRVEQILGTPLRLKHDDTYAPYFTTLGNILIK